MKDYISDKFRTILNDTLNLVYLLLGLYLMRKKIIKDIVKHHYNMELTNILVFA